MNSTCSCTYPQHIRVDIEKLEDVTLRIPEKQEDTDEDILNILPRKDLYAYTKRRQLYRQNKATFYSVVIRKCKEAMHNRLEGEESFDDIEKY